MNRQYIPESYPLDPILLNSITQTQYRKEEYFNFINIYREMDEYNSGKKKRHCDPLTTD